MGRNGIVDERLHTVLPQIGLQRIALCREHREQVIDVLAIGHRARQPDQPIADFLLVAAANLLATGIVGIEVAQLHAQQRSLQLVHA